MWIRQVKKACPYVYLQQLGHVTAYNYDMKFSKNFNFANFATDFQNSETKQRWRSLQDGVR